MIWRLVLGILLNYAASLFAKPPDGPKSSNLADFGIPRADEGARIIDFGGTIWIKDPHIAWYGDFASRAIKKKNKKK